MIRLTNSVISTTDNLCAKAQAWLIQTKTLINHNQNGLFLLNHSIEECPTEEAHFLKGYVLFEAGNGSAALADFEWVVKNGEVLVEQAKIMVLAIR